MSNVTSIPSTATVREQAEAEIQAEVSKQNLVEMKNLIRQRESTQKVLNGINRQIADLEQRIIDGTA